VHGEIFNWFEQRSIRKDLALMMSLVPGQTALDVGCGTGNITLKLLQAGFHVTAVDLSEPMLDILAAKGSKYGSFMRIVCKDVDSFLQESHNTYDAVTLSSVLHHQPDYLTTVSQLLARINPGGCIYITHEPSGRPLRSMFGRTFFMRLDFQIGNWLAECKGCSRPELDFSYSDYHVLHGFDSDAVVKCINQAGFKIICLRFYSGIMQLGISSLIDNNVYHADGQFTVFGHKPLF
jgi:ubiquinone/menaquinone biosynthesis C-methylase UbiE